MRPISRILACSFLLASCRIEPTPQHYIDAQATAAERIAAAETELRDRLTSLATAVGAGSTAGVTLALAPHPELRVIGPEEGQVIRTSVGILNALTGPAGVLRTDPEDIEVTVDPDLEVAWFDARLTPTTGDGVPGYRFTGVVVRESGEWRLIHGHISRPFNPDQPSP